MKTCPPGVRRRASHGECLAHRAERPRAKPAAPPAAAAPRVRPAASHRRPEEGAAAQATEELRGALSGREHEFLGIVLIVVGALLALAIYFGLAGPLGRGIGELFGWFTGLARFALPLALIVVGVALVRSGRSSSPWRLAIGWGLVAAAVLGLLHVINGPDGVSGLSELEDGGGVIGAVVAEPLEALIATPGAVVVLVGLLIGGIALITQTSLRTIATGTGRGVGAVAVPLGRAARNALRELSSLSSDERVDESADGSTDATLVMGERAGLPPPYDAAADFDDGATRCEPPGLARAGAGLGWQRGDAAIGRTTGGCRRSPCSIALARPP